MKLNESELNIKINIQLSLWSAIKLRIAGGLKELNNAKKNIKKSRKIDKTKNKN